jgi:hypothetical protein
MPQQGFGGFGGGYGMPQQGGFGGGYGMPPQPMGGRRPYGQSSYADPRPDPFKPLIQRGPDTAMGEPMGIGTPPISQPMDRQRQPGQQVSPEMQAYDDKDRADQIEKVRRLGLTQDTSGGTGMPPMGVPPMGFGPSVNNFGTASMPPIGEPMGGRRPYGLGAFGPYNTDPSRPLVQWLGPTEQNLTPEQRASIEQERLRQNAYDNPGPTQEELARNNAQRDALMPQAMTFPSAGGTPPMTQPPMQPQVMRPPAMPQAPNSQQVAFESPRMQAMRNMQRRGGPNR